MSATSASMLRLPATRILAAPTVLLGVGVFQALVFVSSLHAEATGQSQDQSRFYPAAADHSISKGFYSKGSARTTFSDSVAGQDRPSIEFFPRRPIPEAEETEAEDSANPQLVPAKLKSEGAASSEAPRAPAENSSVSGEKPADKSAELLKTYGDPQLETPVEAQANAPKPFRAMMAALEAGEGDLAFKYARQYVRYMGRLQERSTRVVGLAGAAMEREGMIEPGSWQASKDFATSQDALKRDVEEDDKRNPGAVEMSDAANALLAKARNFEQENLTSDSRAPSTRRAAEPSAIANPQTDRARLRQELAGQVPIDPGAKVQVYFFLKPLDGGSQRMGRELQTLFAAARGRLDLIAVSAKPMNDQEEQRFRAQTGATYPIQPDGSSIARMMEIRSVPATVLVTPRLNRAFAIGGVKEAAYVQEVINLMEGR